MPVFTTTQEAEVGESLKPRRWKLQQTEITPLHSSLGNRARLHLKTNQTNKNNSFSNNAFIFIISVSCIFLAQLEDFCQVLLFIVGFYVSKY